MSQESMLVALSTAGPIIGSAIGVWKKPTVRHIHIMLYFAAGIMMSISFVDLVPESIRLGSTLTCLAGLVAGTSLMWAVDRLFPHIHECAVCSEEECHLGRTANVLILHRWVCLSHPAGVHLPVRAKL